MNEAQRSELDEKLHGSESYSTKKVLLSPQWLIVLGLILFVASFSELPAQNSATAQVEARQDAAVTQPEAIAKKNDEPWRLSKALSFPEWLTIGLNHRSRYEGLTNEYRNGVSTDQPIYAMRTLLSAEAKWTNLTLRTEAIDARVYFAAPTTPLDTTFVDTFDVLQGFAELRFPSLFTAEDELRVKGGRFTMDLGNRRLVARNRFRNTINAFTGIDTDYKFASGDRLQAFFTMPVQRLPDSLPDLQSNQSRRDFESPNVIFGGFVHEHRSLLKPVVGEFYALGLSEEDSADLQTRNRKLITPGLRLYLPAKAESFDFEIESAVQTGTSRLTTKPTDTTDLAHFAYFAHASAGYTLRFMGQTRFSLEYQYASGNPASNSGKNGRFDPLFGARRSMFGPTNLYGAIALSNINTPGARVEIKPNSQIRTFLA